MTRREDLVYNQNLSGYRSGPSQVVESDEQLAARAAIDAEAFAELHRRYVDPIFRFCQRRLHSEDGIEDATNQIFLQALESLQKTSVHRVRPWLFSIARNVVTDRYRGRRGDVAIDSAGDFPGTEQSPEETALANSEIAGLYAALAALTPDQRHIIELRLSGLTGPEIRVVLGRSRAWVDTTQCRALKRLRVLLVPNESDRTSR